MFRSFYSHLLGLLWDVSPNWVPQKYKWCCLATKIWVNMVNGRLRFYCNYDKLKVKTNGIKIHQP